MDSVNTYISAWAPDIAPLAESLVATGLPEDATMIYDGRRNKVVKLTRQGRDINIKAFRVPNIVNRIVYGTLRGSKARRSYEHALRLRNLGFNTPEPLGYVELSNGMLFGRSYYICQQLEGFRDMRSFEGHDSRSLANLADDLGSLMARLHEAGVWMKDFSQGNLLYRPVPRGHFEFFMIDINRMEFNVNDPAKLMLNFRAITDDEHFLVLLAKAYARHAHKPKAEIIAAAKHVRADFLKSRQRKKILKNLKKAIGL